MIETSLADIKSQALALHSSDTKWHFHVLTPDCGFNDSSQYAFILEAFEGELVLVHHSEQAEKDLARELSPLLHGSDVMNSASVGGEYVPSKTIQHMREHAIALNEAHVQWHHHMLYPECIFNKNSPSYTLLLESSDDSETIESITAHDPKDDLKQIENLFFVN